MLARVCVRRCVRRASACVWIVNNQIQYYKKKAQKKNETMPTNKKITVAELSACVCGCKRVSASVLERLTRWLDQRSYFIRIKRIHGEPTHICTQNTMVVVDRIPFLVKRKVVVSVLGRIRCSYTCVWLRLGQAVFRHPTPTVDRGFLQMAFYSSCFLVYISRTHTHTRAFARTHTPKRAVGATIERATERFVRLFECIDDQPSNVVEQKQMFAAETRTLSGFFSPFVGP